MNENKVYVDVIVKYTKEGKIRPLQLIWTDDTTYEIDRVTDIRNSASLKAGGMGLRFTCIISGHESFLYFEERTNKWFVEKKS